MYASWWEKAQHEILTFPGGKNDDFVDAISQLCGYIHNMVKAPVPVNNSRYIQPEGRIGIYTLKELKRAHKLVQKKKQSLYSDR